MYVKNLPKSNDTQLSLFADETALLASSWKAHTADNKTQKHLNKISDYFQKWKIKINANKTNITCFTS